VTRLWAERPYRMWSSTSVSPDAFRAWRLGTGRSQYVCTWRMYVTASHFTSVFTFWSRMRQTSSVHTVLCLLSIC